MKLRDYCLYEQSSGEAGQARQIGEQLRLVRAAARCSRAGLARLLGVDLTLLVAIENGYGPPGLGQEVLACARRLCRPHQTG